MLRGFGITLESLHPILVTVVGRGEMPVGSVRYTPRAERALAFAQAEAKELGTPRVDTLHLLLGLIHERGDLAVGVPSTSMGIDPEEVRKKALRALGQDTEG